MSKYAPLWIRIAESGQDRLTLSHEEIGKSTGSSLDHAFLTDKKEPEACGYRVGKISLKEQTVCFEKIGRK